jgi:hypothetical protein
VRQVLSLFFLKQSDGVYIKKEGNLLNGFQIVHALINPSANRADIDAVTKGKFFLGLIG